LRGIPAISVGGAFRKEWMTRSKFFLRDLNEFGHASIIRLQLTDFEKVEILKCANAMQFEV
jgi:hypothetical protein